MNIRFAQVFSLSLLFAIAGGCGLGTADPLLYDDEGTPRTSVFSIEVDEAGVVESCVEMQDVLESSIDVVRVPVIGGEGHPVLVGVDGLALCLEDEEEEEGGLEGMTVGDETDSGNSDTLNMGTGSDENTGLNVIPPDGQSNSIDRRTHLIEDPTPEPAND